MIYECQKCTRYRVMNIPGQSTATRISWPAAAIPVAYCGVDNPESKFPWLCSQYIPKVKP